MMKKQLLFFIFAFIVSSSMLISCSGNDELKPINIQSDASVEYLCSSLYWVYFPDEGVHQGTIEEQFSFISIAGINECTIEKFKTTNNPKEPEILEKEKYNFTFNSPIVTLTDKNGEVIRKLTVYKLTRENINGLTNKWLLIDGKIYNGYLTGVNI